MVNTINCIELDVYKSIAMLCVLSNDKSLLMNTQQTDDQLYNKSICYCVTQCFN